MRRIDGLLLLFVLLVFATDAHAQFRLPNPYAYGGGFQFSYARGGLGRGLQISGGFGGPRYGVAPVFPLPGPFYPPTYNRITLIQYQPPPPPLVVFLPPLPPREELRPAELPRFFDPPPMARPAAPRKEDPKAKPEKPPAELPVPPEPKADPTEEADRQLRLGKEAFKALEYGRSAQRFRQAVRMRPAEAGAYFLLTQSLIAQGKYHEAQDAILAGLVRKPDWPTTAFRPLEMYEAPIEYTEQLRALEETVARHPGDPVLFFVAGYALWFDGRQDEAGQLFQRALERARDRGPIERFLAALPAGEKL